MFLEISVIIASTIGGLTAITLGAMSYAKHLATKESEADRYEFNRLNPLPPKPPEPSRDEAIPEYQAPGAVTVCPLCARKNTDATSIPSGPFCRELLLSGGQKALGGYAFDARMMEGPSSAVSVIVKGKPRLWQCCSRCLGEWIIEKVNIPDKAKEDLIERKKKPPHPPPRKMKRN